MRPTAREFKTPDWAACEEKARLYKLPIEVASTGDDVQIYVDRACAHNEYAAFRNRVAFEVPSPSSKGITSLRKLFSLKAKHMILGMESAINTPVREGRPIPWSPEAVVAYYGPTTPKGKLYTDAYRELRFRDLEPRDSNVTMFVKAEKLLTDSNLKYGDPRAIQFRGVVYSAALARYTLALERTFYLCTPGATKGLNSSKKGEVMSDIILKYANPTYLELDCSRFDAHVSEALLRCEHHFYNCIFSTPKLAKMLRAQVENKVYSRSGLKYTVRGGRMSGDMNTALGNNVLQWGMIRLWLVECGLSKFDYIFDGDDSVIVIERKDVGLVKASIYENLFGMKAKLKVLYELELVEYCKGMFFGVPGDLVFGRNPIVSIHKDLYTTKLLTSQKQVDSYMYTLGLCMCHQYDSIPVMWALANAVRARYPKGIIYEGLRMEVNRGVTTVAREPTQLQRATLEYYGWSSAFQTRLEKSFRLP